MIHSDIDEKCWLIILSERSNKNKMHVVIIIWNVSKNLAELF